MHKVKELKIWQKAIDLATLVYRATEGFPQKETYGLTSQIRRSVVSISSNIAEGTGRNSEKEFLHFLSIAHGSCYELETQLIISKNLGLINENNLKPLLIEIQETQKMNYKFQQMLRNKLKNPEPNV